MNLGKGGGRRGLSSLILVWMVCLNRRNCKVNSHFLQCNILHTLPTERLQLHIKGNKASGQEALVCACVFYVNYSGFPSRGFRPLLNRYRTAIIILIMRAAVTHARRMAKAQRVNIEWLKRGGGADPAEGRRRATGGASARQVCVRGSAHNTAAAPSLAFCAGVVPHRVTGTGSLDGRARGRGRGMFNGLFRGTFLVQV